MSATALHRPLRSGLRANTVSTPSPTPPKPPTPWQPPSENPIVAAARIIIGLIGGTIMVITTGIITLVCYGSYQLVRRLWT